MATPKRFVARALRAVADRLDPLPPEPPHQRPSPGMYVLDFSTGTVWLDGNVISKAVGHG